MSRYELIPLARPALEIAVGWDTPLSTFFAQVVDCDRHEDDPERYVRWIGCTPGEFRDPLTVIEAVKAYAVIPDDLYSSLYADAHAGAA